MFSSSSKFNTLKWYAAAGACCLALMFSSCDKHPQVEGTWTGNSLPLDNVSGAFTANATDAITFNPIQSGNESGTVTISTILSAQQALTGTDSIGAYQETVAATATIDGNWSYVKGEDDEINIVLDYNTLNVRVDPSGVAFSQNYLSGREQAEVINLSAQAAQRWTMALTSAMRTHYSHYVQLDDVKVKGQMLTVEQPHSDVKYVFMKQGK